MYIAAASGAEAVVGADVRGRLFPADVLLPRGKRENETAPPVPVLRLSDEAAGQAPHVLLPAGEHAQGRPAEGAGDAQALPFAGRRCRRPGFPGLFRSPKASASVKQETNSAPPEWAVSAAACKFSMQPKKFGDCTATAARSRISSRRARSVQPRFEIGDFHEFIASGGEVGPDDLPVMGVDRPGQRHLLLVR